MYDVSLLTELCRIGFEFMLLLISLNNFPAPVRWFLEYQNVSLLHQDGRKKRTAKRLCVTNVTGLLIACFVVIDINVFWSFTERSVKRKLKFGGMFFQAKLLSRLSHRVCRFPPSPVLLLKFTNNSPVRELFSFFLCSSIKTLFCCSINTSWVQLIKVEPPIKGIENILGSLSNRKATSIDDGARRSNNWLNQWQRGKLGTGSRV